MGAIKAAMMDSRDQLVAIQCELQACMGEYMGLFSEDAKHLLWDVHRDLSRLVEYLDRGELPLG